MGKFQTSSKGGLSKRDPRRVFIEKHGYGDNWWEARARALKRDNHTCQRCGFHGNGLGKERRTVFAHHKRKIKLFVNLKEGTVNYKEANDLSNLITLCKFCHRVADSFCERVGMPRIR